MRISGDVALLFENHLPGFIRYKIEKYVSWFQRYHISLEDKRIRQRKIIKWSLNALVVITAFTVGSEAIYPLLEHSAISYAAAVLSWFFAFALSAPSLWAMLSTFKPGIIDGMKIDIQLKDPSLLVSCFLTISLLGLLSLNYFPALLTSAITIGFCALLFFLFRHQIGSYYHWIENQFYSNFKKHSDSKVDFSYPVAQLAPWEAHLVEIKVPSYSFFVGRSLINLKLRQKYGVNIVAIKREKKSIVAPKPQELIFPGDQLLCFGTDAEIEVLEQDISQKKHDEETKTVISDYRMLCFRISSESPVINTSIESSGIGAKYGCIVVGIERGRERIKSPKGEFILREHDHLWVVGEASQLEDMSTLLI